MSAMIPATSGVDIDVPQPIPDPPPSSAIGAHSGAANFTQDPWLEKLALLPVRRHCSHRDRSRNRRGELRVVSRIVSGCGDDEHSGSTSPPDCGLEAGAATFGPYEAHVDDGRPVVDGVVDGLGDVDVECDAAPSDDLEWKHAAAEARANASDPVA